MKNIKERKNSQIIHFFNKYKVLSKTMAWLLTIAILNLSVSCSYFNVRSVPTTKENMAAHIKAFNESQKYIIVHSNDHSWYLDNMVLDEDDQTISGIILPINARHQYRKPRDSKRVHSYKPDRDDPLN